MARFFIDRPIFAWVLAIVLMLAGVLSIPTLPVSQYPNIAPPTISIRANYPGANAKTLEDSVTQVIEQRMNGIDGLRYFSSTSDSAGNVEISLTFDADTDPDIAQVQVQNKLQLALPLLPQEVQQQGIFVNKSVRNFLLVIGFVSEDGRMGNADLGDFIVSTIQDPLSRVPGVGDIQVFGTQYAMRIWLDPDKLYSYRLTVNEVSAAIQAQNAQISAGQLGGLPAVPGQLLNATIVAQTRLETPEQFGNILLRVNPDGSQVLLKDVSRIELDQENFRTLGRYNGMPSAGMAIRPATGANALDAVALVKERVAELEPFFPPGVKVVYPMDTTPFVKTSIKGVIHTLIEAVILVFLVMYLFLQNFRATLIPTIAIPVVLLGTFAVMAVFGFSINTLTLFGLVLAIGLLVDDAIVVVENVERIMSEEGLSPLEATRKSMDQITGALVGIGLVLSAVFVPMAFFGGSTGVIYRQFSITIVTAMALSVFVAIILTPALCATLLKPMDKDHHHGKKGFFGWFNRVFDKNANRYANGVRAFIQRSVRMMLIYLGIIGLLAFLFWRLPSGFLPDEDQGLMYVQAQLPAGSTMEQSLEVLKKSEHHFLVDEKEAIDGMFGVTGFSFSGSGQNQVFGFIQLKDWSERDSEDLSVWAVQQRAMAAFSEIKEAFVVAFAPPAVLELGNVTGFDLRITDNANLGHAAMMDARNQLLGLAGEHPGLQGVRPNGLEDTPEFKINVDQEKASALGLSLSDINRTLSTAWGSSYVNDFIDKGRVKRVYLQADAPFRMLPEDINRWYVRNNSGEMVPFSVFSNSYWSMGSPRLERYNGIPAISIVGEPSPGNSSGEAMLIMEELIKELPPGVGYEWTGLSYEERLTGSQAPALYAISLLIVFLCLAALYESWTIPASVMMIVPLGVIGTLLAATFNGLPNDVYFQVGLLTIVGLSAKNAILIVEFAKAGVEEGKSLIDAAVYASRQRLRPIIMTSMAFGLGVTPLAISTGAGSGSQNAIGIGVLGGTISSTILGVLLVPVFFYVVMRIFGSKTQTLAKKT